MEAQVKEGELYKERKEKMKFPRIIRVRKIAKMGSLAYVFFMAENQTAQAAHPNGGFIPLESFLDTWVPYDSKDPKYSGGNGQA